MSLNKNNIGINPHVCRYSAIWVRETRNNHVLCGTLLYEDDETRDKSYTLVYQFKLIYNEQAVELHLIRKSLNDE